MERYANRGGDSSIHSYELSPGRIVVKFNDSFCYTYTDKTAGAHHIAEMHHLAQQGHGLNRYIMHNVKKDYTADSPHRC